MGAGEFEIISGTVYAAFMETPIACALSEPELRLRRQTILQLLHGATVKVEPLPGVARFTSSQRLKFSTISAAWLTWSVDAAPFSLSKLRLEPPINLFALKYRDPQKRKP